MKTTQGDGKTYQTRQSRTHIITFQKDGNASCVYTDALPLTQLGNVKIKRISMIEWIEKDQKWGVRWVGQKEIVFKHESREQCVAWEIAELTNIV